VIATKAARGCEIPHNPENPFEDLPLLADMLTYAGCTDADILEHCRSGGEHVRGCWAVDLLLGKT
jgi:hypothetical protein